MSEPSGLIIGHRGIASLAPENTLGGFRKAAELGVGWVELDVTLLADGTPVVNHDDSIDRCSNRSGLLAELRREDLAGINNAAYFPGWPQAEPLPLLQDVLRLLDQLGVGLNLELKAWPGAPEQLVQPVIDLLKRYFPRHSDNPPGLILSSFSPRLIACCRNLAPSMPRALVFDDLPTDWLEHARAVDAYSIHCDWRYLSYARVRAIRNAGFELYCWTLNDPRDAASLWHWGLSGVITDRPQLFTPATPA